MMMKLNYKVLYLFDQSWLILLYHAQSKDLLNTSWMDGTRKNLSVTVP